MAQIDSNIYFNQQVPDIVGNYQKGYQQGVSMRELANQRQKEKAIEEAYKSSIVTNPDGSTSLDQRKTLSSLAKVDPQSFLNAQAKFNEDAVTKQKLNYEKVKQFTEYLGNASDTVRKNPAMYQDLLTDAKYRGYDISMMPPQYGPEAQRKLDFLFGQALTAREKLENQFKQKEIDLKKGELDFKKSELAGKKQKDAGELASNLRKERSGLPTTKATQEISAAYNKIQTAAKNPSAAGDMSLIFGYMKILDPGSTVREGEYATAEQARGVDSKVVGLYNRILNGERLTPDQRKDFMNQAGGLYKSQLSIQKQIDSQFTDLAKKSGADPKDVILNFEANNPNQVQTFKTNQIEWAD